VVWDRDLLAIDPLSLNEARVERTMVGGRWLFEA